MTATKKSDRQDSDIEQLFELFVEIGIVNQLSITEFNRCMPENLHVSHFSVLNHLVRRGDGKTPKEITSAFQVTKGTMTNTLNDLSERGFIKLKPHETDGRSKVVFITKAGQKFQQRAIDSLVPSMTDIAQLFAPKNTKTCLPILRELRIVLDEYRDEK